MRLCVFSAVYTYEVTRTSRKNRQPSRTFFVLKHRAPVRNSRTEEIWHFWTCSCRQMGCDMLWDWMKEGGNNAHRPLEFTQVSIPFFKNLLRRDMFAKCGFSLFIQKSAHKNFCAKMVCFSTSTYKWQNYKLSTDWGQRAVCVKFFSVSL